MAGQVYRIDRGLSGTSSVPLKCQSGAALLFEQFLIRVQSFYEFVFSRIFADSLPVLIGQDG